MDALRAAIFEVEEDVGGDRNASISDHDSESEQNEFIESLNEENDTVEKEKNICWTGETSSLEQLCRELFLYRKR